MNLLACTASLWRGDGELCRWCNAEPARQRGFCSRECRSEMLANHVYNRAKAAVREASRGPCRHSSIKTTAQGAYFDPLSSRVVLMRYPTPHARCRHCDRCEEELVSRGLELTCNHIRPRFGISTADNHCIHHQDNLEMLCSPEHGRLTMIQNRLMRSYDDIEVVARKLELVIAEEL